MPPCAWLHQIPPPFHPHHQPTTTTILSSIFLSQTSVGHYNLPNSPPLTANLSPSIQMPPTITSTPPSLPHLPSTIWSQPPFSVSAIVSTPIVLHKFMLTSIFKSFQTLDNFPKTSQLNHSPKFIHSARPNLSDNQPIVVQDTYRSAMPVARLGKSDVGLYSWPLLVWWWYRRCAPIQTQHKDTTRQAVFSTNNNQETKRHERTNKYSFTCI